MTHSRLLIVDDSEIDRYILKRQLKSKGFSDVIEMDNGVEALAYLQRVDSANTESQPPDLIILDVNMPRMGGFELLTEATPLFETGALHNTLVLMYSGSDSDAEKQLASEFPWVRGFLQKGATPEQLESLVNGVLVPS